MNRKMKNCQRSSSPKKKKEIISNEAKTKTTVLICNKRINTGVYWLLITLTVIQCAYDIMPSHFTEAVEINPIQAKASNESNTENMEKKQKQHLESEDVSIQDMVEDGFYDPISPDPSCNEDPSDESGECWNPPASTIEEETVVIDATAMYGGDDPSDTFNEDDDDNNSINCDENATNEDDGKQCKGKGLKTKIVDKHWGSDESTLKMRDQLRNVGRGSSSFDQKRPPIFLMPGLASTRLIAWRFKSCNNKLLSDVKVQDNVWMNINMMIQMATIDTKCFLDCMTLGINQTDMDDDQIGCKLRPDEGLDAISSLAPGSVTTNMLIGGKNTVYAWLTQWLADNLGYDVSNIVGLPYDWRLSPDVMEKRDGFLTLTRKRIEASVASNGQPGIMVAHSMGNTVFRYFLEWLKIELHNEAYDRLLKNLEKREAAYEPGRKKEETAAFLGPDWGSSNKNGDNDKNEYVVKFDAKDRMYTLANSVADLWQQYFPDNEQRSNEPGDYFLHDFYEWKKLNDGSKFDHLWELAQAEGDEDWLDWIHKHVWTYIGLSAPLLGAINPVRAVISGENMGMPVTDDEARKMELSFGSTHTISPISTRTGFCDDTNDTTKSNEKKVTNKSNLACLDELIDGIEKNNNGQDDPWGEFPALKSILKDRVDWDSTFPTFTAQTEQCSTSSKRPSCSVESERHFSPKDVQSGDLFSNFNEIWKEEDEPLKVKKAQLENSWWNNPLPNILNSTWDRPHIKHVIMAYGVDDDTEVGYVYTKQSHNDQPSDYDGIPTLKTIIHETSEGRLYEESRIEEKKSLTDSVLMKKTTKTRELIESGEGILKRSGDASVPYLSLAWSHTWLLHATRAMRHSKYHSVKEGERISDYNALDSIKVTYRPKGGSEWLDSLERLSSANNETNSDTVVTKTIQTEKNEHPHGTKYKPEMYRYQSKGKSRSTGMEYTTAVIEAVGVEHKETTRNYDVLAAVFTDVLNNMHDDFDIV